MEMSDLSLRVLADLLEARSGQRLADGRRWRLDVTLGPLLRERGYRNLDQLVAALVADGHGRLADAVVDALLNNETFFFRDAAAFALVEQRALVRLAAARADAKRLRIWSAGCSTGQEAFSLAMIFADAAERWRGWQIDIIGTDLSRTAIARARAGLYSQFEIQRGLPVGSMLRHFRQEGDGWRIDPALARTVHFQVRNIVDPPPGGAFDLILCRNLLFYLLPAMRKLACARLAAAIAPDGALMLGAGETVIGNTDAFVSDYEARGLYRPRVSVPEPRPGGATG